MWYFIRIWEKFEAIDKKWSEFKCTRWRSEHTTATCTRKYDIPRNSYSVWEKKIEIENAFYSLHSDNKANVAEILLQNKANPNNLNEVNNTALNYAAFRGKHSVLTKNMYRILRPFSWIHWVGDQAAVSLLIKYGVDVNRRVGNDHDRTALHTASEQSNHYFRPTKYQNLSWNIFYTQRQNSPRLRNCW